MDKMTSLDGRWIELKDRAIFRITGPDRVRYLNGQVTNDVAGPLDERAITACVCSLKGKVEFLIWISAFGDCLFVDGQLDQRDELFERLDRYLIADDCEIEDVTGQWKLIHHFEKGLSGVHSRRTGTIGFDFFCETLPDLPEAKRIAGEEFNEEQWRALIPASPWEITGNEFPAELGIADWTVDFHKGCYLGQEIISRIKSVGTVKRTLILVTAETKLVQDSIVRTDDGFEGRITRALKTSEEKKFYGFCLMKLSSKNALPVDLQRVKRVTPAEMHI
ncbi:MAG: hypothetical protein P1U68_09580 [Verrucomicrobiales bacterium]|nr:hypothetical protein [Verrucomicrobiales bacterium]